MQVILKQTLFLTLTLTNTLLINISQYLIKHLHINKDTLK